jgi:hypothetical protein
MVLLSLGYVIQSIKIREQEKNIDFLMDAQVTNWTLFYFKLNEMNQKNLEESEIGTWPLIK